MDALTLNPDSSSPERAVDAMRKGSVVAVVAATAAAGCAAAAAAVVWYRRSTWRWNRADRIVRDLREGCSTPATKLWEVADAMAAEMRAGLAREGLSSLRMLVSPIESLPSSIVNGVFYGLNIGRTKVRMMRVHIGEDGANITKKDFSEVPVPSNLMVGTSAELYNYIAAELSKFIKMEDVGSGIPSGTPKGIGLTVSFPVLHDPTLHDTIIKWTKGFSIKDIDGRDAVTGMNKAMEKHGIEMKVSLLVNDTIGALAGGRYCSRDTVAAVILGMGTNAGYTEPTDAVPKWRCSRPKQEELVINMEWGNFQSSHLPFTEFDVDLDTGSPKPGKEIFEKLIAGMHLGEIVRRVLLKINEDTALFGDDFPVKLRIPYVLRTPDVASMHQDTSQDLCVVREKLQESLGISDTTLRMRKLVVDVCDIIVSRGARLAAAGIVGILKRLGRDGTHKKGTVAVEGGLYEHYRLYRNYLHDGVKEMLHGRLSDNVVIEQLHDESRIGAAILSTVPDPFNVSSS